MAKDKIWKVKSNNNMYSDEELIELIKNHQINLEEEITTKEMKQWIKIIDSVYAYYAKEVKHETI